jgi:hypothetical protein
MPEFWEDSLIIAGLYAPSRNQIHLASKYRPKFMCEMDETHAHWAVELHQNVHIAFRAIITPAHRTEQSH